MASSLYKVKNRDSQWELASRQFIRAMRGKRSQLALSRRLGYRSKPVADWESGRRFPTAATVLSGCQTIGIDVQGALLRFHAGAAQLADDLSPNNVAHWLNHLRGSTPIIALAERASQPRFSVSRWLSGQSQPRLPQFFSLLHAITGRAPDLIAELVDIQKVPAICDEHERQRAGRQLAFEEPWTAAVQRVLETEAYLTLPLHKEGWIASYLGIPSELESRCLARLVRAGMIREHQGKFQSDPSTVDTRRTEQENLAIKLHWAEVAAARLRQDREEDVFAYNVVSASSEDCQRIEVILRSAYREIRSLVAASEPSEEVALVQVQMVRWKGEKIAQS